MHINQELITILLHIIAHLAYCDNHSYAMQLATVPEVSQATKRNAAKSQASPALQWVSQHHGHGTLPPARRLTLLCKARPQHHLSVNNHDPINQGVKSATINIDSLYTVAMTSESQILGHVPDRHVLAGAHKEQSFNNPRTTSPNIKTGCAWYDMKILALI